jgi:glycosyltransferase involved in cell wall biosynthesis
MRSATELHRAPTENAKSATSNADGMTEAVTAPASRNDPCPCGSGKRYKHCHGAPPTAQSALNSNGVIHIGSGRELAIAGLTAHRAGDLDAAERLYRESLKTSPLDPDVLHMLGVVLMQKFDYTQARQFIEQAGELIEWCHPDFLHNRAHLLSVYLSGRAVPDLDVRIANLAAQREQHAGTALKHLAVVAIFESAPLAHRASPTLPSLENTSELHIKRYVATVAGQSNHPKSFPLAIRSALETALQDGAGVVLMLSGDAVVLTREQSIAEMFRATGADWGVFAPEDVKHFDSQAQRLHAAKITRLRNTKRVGSVLLEDNQLHSFFSVCAFKSDFIRRLVSTVSLENVYGLVFNALRLSEPVFLSTDAVSYSAGAAGKWWQQDGGAFDEYVTWALEVKRPENALAPSIEVDGLGFLKRPLRVWIGRYLKPKTLNKIASLIDSRVPVQPRRNDGVEYIGFARAESGLGESLRLLVRATESINLPCAVGEVALDVGMRQADSSIGELIVSKPEFRTRVVCVNPDSLGEALALDGHDAVRNTDQIGYWYWELERIPQRWADASLLFKEIWVASKFVADAVSGMTKTPVRIITPPLLAPRLTRSFSRTEFGLVQDEYVFLFSFAYGSFASRKNPEAVVRAFREAFPRAVSNVRLLIKTSQAELFPEHVESLEREVAGDARISFINRTLTREELTGLQSVADCYVSLHRSEGLGLGMAESMSLGKPTIGTAYSGNLVFMNESNSLLVDYRLIPIRPGEYIDADGQRWADASIDDAARKMRYLFENQVEGRILGERARMDLASQFSLVAVGQRIRDALSFRLS